MAGVVAGMSGAGDRVCGIRLCWIPIIGFQNGILSPVDEISEIITKVSVRFLYPI